MVFPKAVIGLFLALVLQLAQAQTWLATLSDADCERVAKPPACDCCVGEDKCPCLAQAPQQENRLPLAPPAAELKIQIAAPVDADVTLVITRSPDSGRMLEHAVSREVVSGYAGVPLAVAYCRYLI